MNCVSYDICVYHRVYRLWFVFLPWGIPQLQSGWSLSCDHGLDYVRTTKQHKKTTMCIMFQVPGTARQLNEGGGATSCFVLHPIYFLALLSRSLPVVCQIPGHKAGPPPPPSPLVPYVPSFFIARIIQHFLPLG